MEIACKFLNLKSRFETCALGQARPKNYSSNFEIRKAYMRFEHLTKATRYHRCLLLRYALIYKFYFLTTNPSSSTANKSLVQPKDLMLSFHNSLFISSFCAPQIIRPKAHRQQLNHISFTRRSIRETGKLTSSSVLTT